MNKQSEELLLKLAPYITVIILLFMALNFIPEMSIKDDYERLVSKVERLFKGYKIIIEHKHGADSIYIDKR